MLRSTPSFVALDSWKHDGPRSIAGGRFPSLFRVFSVFFKMVRWRLQFNFEKGASCSILALVLCLPPAEDVWSYMFVDFLESSQFSCLLM
jgi:hypothetical protein